MTSIVIHGCVVLAGMMTIGLMVECLKQDRHFEVRRHQTRKIKRF